MAGVTLAVSGVAVIVIFGPRSAQALDALFTLLLLHGLNMLLGRRLFCLDAACLLPAQCFTIDIMISYWESAMWWVYLCSALLSLSTPVQQSPCSDPGPSKMAHPFG